MAFSRDDIRDFLCPVTACEASYNTGPDLQFHIDHQHVFLTSVLQPAIPQTNPSPTIPQNDIASFSPLQVQGIVNAYNVQPISLTHAQQTELIAQAFGTVGWSSNTAQPTREMPNANMYNAPSRPSNVTQQPRTTVNTYNVQPRVPNTTQRPQTTGNAYTGGSQPISTTQQRHQRQTSNPINVHRAQPSNSPQLAHQRQHSNPVQTTWTQPSIVTQQVQPQSSLSSQVYYTAPQVYANSGQPPSPPTGMRPPTYTRNQSAGSTGFMFANDPVSDIAAAPAIQSSSRAPDLLVSQRQIFNNDQVSTPNISGKYPPADRSKSLRCVWPSKAELTLRSLLIRHSLVDLPLEKIDRSKFVLIFTEFAKICGLDFMGMDTSNSRILIIFKNKVMELQHIIRRNYNEQRRQQSEAVRRQQLNEVSMLSRTSVHPTNQSTVLSPIATPPATPIISNAPKKITIKDHWDSRDAEDQIKIFLQLIHSAKDPDRMALVWDKWNEKRGKKRRASDVFVQGLVIERHFEPTSNQTPLVPPPVEDQADDLDSMIERELCEARLKRQREKETNEKETDQTAEKEASAKRLKMTAP